MKDRKVIITGGAGFIGSHLVDLMIRENADVTVLDNFQAGTMDNLSTVAEKINVIECDMRNVEEVEYHIRESAPELVFHLAANASVPGSVDDPAYDFETNCMGTFNVLSAVKQYCPSVRTILASSGAVYGEPTDFPLRETSPIAPISPYGFSKAEAERVMTMFNTVFGMDVVTGRIFNTYGPRMPRFVVLDFLNKLKKDPSRLEILGTGKQVRDFNYVSDTTKALFRIALDGISGESYNIASGTSHTVTELAETLIDILGMDPKPELAFTGKSWDGDAQRWEVSIEKLASLEHNPEISLQDGLKRVIEWHEALQK